MSRPKSDPSDRFLRPAMLVAFAVYGLFAFTFAGFQVKQDGESYFNLLRRFFGEHPDFAFAYQFGSDVWNAPFFLVGRALGAIFGFEPKLFHVSFEEISITVATNVAFVSIVYVGWRLLKELGLPRGPALIFLTVFGTPLFYYVVFEPSGKHAVDTLVLTTAVYVYLRAEAQDITKHAVVLGALAGWSVNIRYVNFAFFLVLGCGLLLRRRTRSTAIGAATALCVGGIIFVLPALRGISYFEPSYFPKTAAGLRLAAPATGPIVGSTSNPLNGFDPTIPLKMLFSDHRGLFVWTPLTALAVLGFLLATRVAIRSGVHRSFFVTLLAAAVALLCVHTIWGFWDGGYSFSQRFLTGLFPVFLIGAAELVRRGRLLAYPAFVLTVAWAVGIAFIHYLGYDGSSAVDGVSRVVHVAVHSARDERLKVQNLAKNRWTYAWGLLHGTDPRHVNG